MNHKIHILPIIIVSQFACTSLWFAGNVIVDQLTQKTGLGTEIIGYVLSSVNLGFIVGTLVFALLMIADRYAPAMVFMGSAFLASICNLVLLTDNMTGILLVLARFGTGFFLAGIYPVGMKIAADYYEKGLGTALGFLVGALVFGTAFPYLVSGFLSGSDYTLIITSTSVLSVIGGILLWLLVPNGPFRKPSTQLRLRAGPLLFKIPVFRKAAYGYFGHMWELYAFWAFTPLAIHFYNELHQSALSIALWTGIIISFGGLSCILGGLWSAKVGSIKVASIALLCSGTLCLLSVLLFQTPPLLFLLAWCLWGMAVTADSPQFSNMVAASVPHELKGTGLTLVNCIGFAISILSIQLVSFLSDFINTTYLFTILAVGPTLGLLSLYRRAKK